MDFTVDVFNSTEHSFQAFLRQENEAGDVAEAPFALAGIHFHAAGEASGSFLVLDPDVCAEADLQDVLGRFHAVVEQATGRRLTEVGIAEALGRSEPDPSEPPSNFNVMKLAESEVSLLLGLKSVGPDGDVAADYTLLLDLFKLGGRRLVASAIVFDPRFFDRERMGALMHWLLEVLPELEAYDERSLELFPARNWGWAELD